MFPVLARGWAALVLAILAAGAWAAPPAPSAASVPAGPAAGFPSRPITIIVTFPPGGGTDLLARKLGQALSARTGQPVIVENRPGASGNIGAQAVAESAPDGYTLLMVNSSFAINPGVFRNLAFSPKRDFDPVINVAFVPSVLVVPAASPHRSLASWLEAAQGDRPQPYASCGNGTPQHLAGEMLALRANVRLQHVPYRGCGPALTDAVAGQVGAAIVTTSSASPFIKAGKLRALAVTSPGRSALLPDVPTVAEQGMPGYELDQWHGLLAPAHTPVDVVQALNAQLAAIVAEPAMRQELIGIGFGPTASTPQEFRELIDGDIDRFAELTARIGLRVD